MMLQNKVIWDSEKERIGLDQRREKQQVGIMFINFSNLIVCSKVITCIEVISLTVVCVDLMSI